MADGHVRAEAAVAELADLVADLKGGGFRERGRILARGARILRGLTPKQRRTVAIEVARQAAPDLVERITAEGGAAGDVDLSPVQLKAVFDMVARLDEEGAGDLASRLRDPEWQKQALGLAATDGLGAVAASAGYEEVGALLEADSLEAYEAAQAGAHAAELDPGLEAEPPVSEEQAAALATAAWDPDGGENIGTDLDPHGDQEAGPELAAYEPAGIDPSLLSFDASASSPAVSTAPATDVADQGTERSWFGGGDLGIAELTPERTSLSARLVGLERPSHRLRLVNDLVGDIAAMAADEQVGVLLALPDGWVRRRALHRLLEADGISRSSAPRLLGVLGREIDRSWVAASMVEAELVLLDDVADVLNDRSRARLHARYEHTEV